MAYLRRRIFEQGYMAPIMGDIDAVVTWVNGSDLAHKKKRALRLAQFTGEKPHASGLVEDRFTDNDEIRYCLRSIRNFAPWIRTVWLVTDEQFPNSIHRTLSEEAGVRVVDHKVIFRQFEHALPTFNSQSIETVLWRIPGLSERFLYFNDDMFLTRMVTPEDFFTDDGILLRGQWKPMHLGLRRTLHAQAKANSARILGFDDEFFSVKHVIYPLLRSTFLQLFREYPEEMTDNLSYPFRDLRQFWPISLHHQLLVQQGRAHLASARDVVHFSLKGIRDESSEHLFKKLRRALRKRTFATCLNNLPAIEAKVPQVRTMLSRATGPSAPFERVRDHLRSNE